MVEAELMRPGASGDVESRQEYRELEKTYYYTMIALIFGIGMALGLSLAVLMKVY